MIPENVKERYNVVKVTDKNIMKIDSYAIQSIYLVRLNYKEEETYIIREIPNKDLAYSIKHELDKAHLIGFSACVHTLSELLYEKMGDR